MTTFIPLKRMLDRIELDRNDSNTAYFNSLLYGYEFITKLVASAFVAALGDDADRHRYRLEHGLVRSSGLGDWVAAMNEAMVGPPSTHLDTVACNHRAELTTKVGKDDWRIDATAKLRNALIELGIEAEPQPAKPQLLQWFRDAVMLRNKTRGHGAPSQARIDAACESVADSLQLVVERLPLFGIPWAYVRRNLSNKYRVCPLGPDDSPFAHMRGSKTLNYEDGVYIAFDVLRPCKLLHTDQDLSDFYVANGGFTDSRYELLSLVTGEMQHALSAPYLQPADKLPGSVTEGLGQLDVVGECFSNLPNEQGDYIDRNDLEEALRAELVATQHHPIVTLDGRGGIGKTSTALHVIRSIAFDPDCPYTKVLWFSARDIDLTPEGAKLVRPAGVTIDDFANQYAALLELPGKKEGGTTPRDALADGLSREIDGPTLYVFDNFETVVSPGEAFNWIDTYIRPPNKTLITTRIRGNFRADFPIHVEGMNDEECNALITTTARRLGVIGKLDNKSITSMIAESEGHPYIVKIFLGEMARTEFRHKVERVMASRDDILEALFERTYDALSPAARRVFLTLAGWRSVVPELAVEAVVVRPGNERLDIHEAVQELISSSLIDEYPSGEDEYFLSVPLAAQVFGRRKLEASPYRGSIADDIKLLQQFGAAQKHDLAQGLEKRLSILFGNIASVVASGERTIDDFLPTIEYVARKVPKAWLYLADLCDDKLEDPDTYVRNCLMHYLERDGRDDSWAWKRIADLYKKAGKVHDEINALVSLSKVPDVPTYVISNVVNRINGLLRTTPTQIDHLDRRQLVQEVATTFDGRRTECDATDLSRLAWLYMLLGEQSKARECVLAGLRIENDNEHCLNLKDRLDRNNG